MPALTSIRRHYEGHFVKYLENKHKIPSKLIVEWRLAHQHQQQEIDYEDEQEDIERAFDAINDGAKIHDVFPLTGYNSTTGINNITGQPCEKLTWREWAYRHLKVEIDGKLVPMILPIHVEDLLKLMDKYPGVLLLIARGHIKSTALQIYVLRKLCDFKWRILFIGGSTPEVERYTENVRNELKENRILLLHYGYLPHPKRGDSKKGLYLRTHTKDFSHDAHLSYATPPKGSSGTSKLGGHPDCIILDDIQGENVCTSDKLKRKHEDWFDRNIMPMRKGKTKLIVAGTRKAYDDIYDYIKCKRFLYLFEKPAIIKWPNGEPDEYILKTRDDGVQYWDGGQSEPIKHDKSKWCYHISEVTETVGGFTTTQKIIDGVENLFGGQVFWKHFRKSAWDDRIIKYYKRNGEYDENLMTMQELLLEKQYLEAKQEKGHFSFSSEFMLDPVETKGRHFNVEKIKHFSYEMWEKIVKDEGVPKYTWIDVGYSLPDESKIKKQDVKKGKTVLFTAAFINSSTVGCEKFTPDQNGMYVLEVRSGNYFIEHYKPHLSLIHQMVLVNETFSPLSICFEENYFGKFIKANAQIYNHHLPIEGKSNKLDKYIRISNGVNTRLANIRFPLWMCKETLGYAKLYRQCIDFPNTHKIDEIDAMESCDRLLIRRSGKMILISTEGILSRHREQGLLGSGFGDRKSYNQQAAYIYYKGRRRY